MRICEVDGCGRKYVAKGACQKHYIERHRKANGRVERKVETKCAACGSSLLKVPSRRYRATCSLRCRYFLTYSKWPAGQDVVGPLPRKIRQTIAPAAELLGSAIRFLSCTCKWCGDSFVHDLRVTGVRPNYCDRRCAKRASASRRQLRQGRFSIDRAARLRIYERDEWICQLCMHPVDAALPPNDRWAATLDHIECQSWALMADHSEANLRLAHRMCNSIRSDERYSAA